MSKTILVGFSRHSGEKENEICDTSFKKNISNEEGAANKLMFVEQSSTYF